VNRYWQLIFGAGLVKTPEDFGVQGELPSHPDLLDWLAVEFQESGWDLKHLLRLIVTSSTYRQSSPITDESREKDPDNRLLGRGARYRLSSHAIRDQALALSGLLFEQVGGEPVKPYQPPGIWEEVSFGGIKFVQSKGTDLHRRSLYTFWRPLGRADEPVRRAGAAILCRASVAHQHPHPRPDHAERSDVRGGGAGHGAARAERAEDRQRPGPARFRLPPGDRP